MVTIRLDSSYTESQVISRVQKRGSWTIFTLSRFFQGLSAKSYFSNSCTSGKQALEDLCGHFATRVCCETAKGTTTTTTSCSSLPGAYTVHAVGQPFLRRYVLKDKIHACQSNEPTCDVFPPLSPPSTAAIRACSGSKCPSTTSRLSTPLGFN